jgi:hypothetical protein
MNYHANFKFRFYFLSIRKVGTNFVSINWNDVINSRLISKIWKNITETFSL